MLECLSLHSSYSIDGLHSFDGTAANRHTPLAAASHLPGAIEIFEEQFDSPLASNHYENNQFVCCSRSIVMMLTSSWRCRRPYPCGIFFSSVTDMVWDDAAFSSAASNRILLSWFFFFPFRALSAMSVTSCLDSSSHSPELSV